MQLELNAVHITKDYIMSASGQKRYIWQGISSKCQRFSWIISRSSRPKVFQEHLRVTAWFSTISREVSHFFLQDSLIKITYDDIPGTYLPWQYQNNENENKLHEDMILITNLVPSSFFLQKRKAIVFQNCSGDNVYSFHSFSIYLLLEY